MFFFIGIGYTLIQSIAPNPTRLKIVTDIEYSLAIGVT
jgi:hypothetical protein